MPFLVSGDLPRVSLAVVVTTFFNVGVVLLACFVFAHGTGGGIRTHTERAFEARASAKLGYTSVPPEGFEPPLLGLKVRCLAAWLRRDGTPGGTRTRRTVCLKHVCMPIPSPGQSAEGWIRTSEAAAAGLQPAPVIHLGTSAWFRGRESNPRQPV